jgi:hypothetical protein
MATRWAVASGNWSSNATWNGTSSIPSNGDTVYANGFNVTINQNVSIGGANNVSVNAGSFLIGSRYVITSVGSTSWTAIGASSNNVGVIFVATGVGSGTGVASTVASINTTAVASIPIVTGGSFTIADTYTLTANIFSGTTACLTFSANSPASAFVIGNASAGSAGGAVGIQNTGTGTITITGNITAGQSGIHGCQNSSTGTINIIGTITGGSGTNAYGAQNASTGTISVTGSAVGGSGNAPAGNNAVAGTFIVTGDVTAGTTSNGLVCSANAASLNIIVGNVTASTTGNGFSSQNSNAINRISGSAFDATNGVTAINANRYLLNATPTQAVRMVALNGVGTFVNFYTADYSGFGQASISDVRSGVSYAAGALTGTAAIPAAGSVALGVPVDATTGTAVLTAANVQTALTSQGLTTARATNLDNLDATITSRSTLTKSDVQGAVIPLL